MPFFIVGEFIHDGTPGIQNDHIAFVVIIRGQRGYCCKSVGIPGNEIPPDNVRLFRNDKIIPGKEKVIVCIQLFDVCNCSGCIPVGDGKFFEIDDLDTPVVHFHIVGSTGPWIE